jgi:hypothetical protein
MSGRLYFPLAEALRVADATLTAPEHGDSFVDREEGRKTGPALMWVKDQGTYLMSNAGGVPDPADVLYGRLDRTAPLLDGTHEDDWDTCRDVCGGDDFAEYLPLNPQVVSQWRDALAEGFQWITLDVSPEQFSVSVTK